MNGQEVVAAAEDILDEVERAIVGKRPVLEMILAAVLAGGHILLEDLPGVAKTLAARSFARVLGLSFKRIQFTPDLLPADIVGGQILQREDGAGVLSFRPGPLFAQVVLADEINRATPKTQSALLEAMQEGQATVEGEARPLPRPFVVLATQNPIEYEGTFPLPEAQLDRFMVRLRLGYPDRAQEVEILARRMERRTDEVVLARVADPSVVLAMRAAVEEVFVDPVLLQYMTDLVARTRGHAALALGVSPRGTLALLQVARARAALAGRGFVIPDDVKAAAFPALAHRLILSPDLWTRQLRTDDVLAEILEQTAVPRTAADTGP
ncbi:MAG TPA: MoxR family ATPase [Bacillota bacterium]|nr:MoxR family ATPase [Bacillota bacterium]